MSSIHHSEPKEVFLTYDVLHQQISPNIDFNRPSTLSLTEILAIWFDQSTLNPYDSSMQTVPIELVVSEEPLTKKRKNT